MKYPIASRCFTLSLLLILSVFLSACQEKPEAPQSPPAEPALAAADLTAEPTPASVTTNQGASAPRGQELEILRFIPSGNIKQLDQLVVMFNQPMVALGDYSQAPEGALVIDPPIEGTARWLNQYTLAFIPAKPLTGSLSLTASVNPSALKSLSGAELPEGMSVAIELPDLAVRNRFQNNDTSYNLEEALKPTWHISFNQLPDEASLAEKAKFIYHLENGDERKVAAEVTSSPEDSDSFIFRPRESLPKATQYDLILEAGAKSASGPKLAPRLELAQSSTYGPLRISPKKFNKPIHPEHGFSLRFANPVDLSEIVNLISIDNDYDLSGLKKIYAKNSQAEDQEEDEPKITGYINSYLNIGGDFKAESEYTLNIDGSAKDIFGQSLGENYVYKFKTSQYATTLDLGDDFSLLETTTDPRFKLLASNIEKAEIKAYAIPQEEAVRFLGAANFEPQGYFSWQRLKEAEIELAGLELLTKTITIPQGAKNGRTRVPVDLKQIFKDSLKGHLLYLASSYWSPRSDETEYHGRTFALVQVTDIGLALKFGPASSLIWTTDLSAGHSWPGVELELRYGDGELLWRGQSDENGLARLPGTAEIAQMSNSQINIWDTGLFVIARSGEQMAIWNATWTSGLENWRWNFDSANAMSDRNDTQHLLLSALPIYKPGEKAKLKIISRVTGADSTQDFPGENIYINISDEYGEVVDKAILKVSPFGTSSHEFTIPADASLGQWVVNAGEDKNSLSPAGSFLVMTYRPPAFEIKFENLPESALAGSETVIEVKADYHFGSPVSGQPASYSVVSSPAWFQLPGDFSDYSVTSSRYQPEEEDGDYDDYAYTEPSVAVTSEECKLDAEGRLRFLLSLKMAPWQKPAPRDYSVYVTATGVDQRTVSANNRIFVHPADIYVGLNSDSGVGETGQAFPIKVIAADWNGRLLPARDIKATVYRRVWQNVRRKSAGTAYDYVSRMVDEKISEHELVSGELPVEIAFVPDQPGYYIVQAEIKDDSGRSNLADFSFYITGRGPVGWEISNDNKITLVADKKSYKPGETARIMIQSPFDQGEGLLTVERAGIHSSKVFKIESQTPIVEVPLSDEDSPNVFVSALLSRGRISETLNESGLDFGKPAIRIGQTELKVPSAKNLLAVAVKTDQAEIGPGEEIEVEITVTDAEGKAMAEAELSLIAADAAVIQLAGDLDYFPQRILHRDQPLRIQTATNLISLIGRQNWGLKGGNPGGGGNMAEGASAIGLRDNFAALAFFEPHLSLDEHGQAKVKIKMPENLSAFKIYAVATGHGLLSGTGQSSVLVSRDLLVRSALPGYAGVGDEFQAAMVVSNRGKKSGQAKVTLSGDNFTILDSAAEQTVTIEPGENREVSFKVKAGKGPEAKFQFTVSMGRDTDGAEFTIPVSPANQLVTEASYERLTGDWRTDIALPVGVDPERGGLELELSPTLTGVLSEPFDWLLAYPHGCVEQSTSKAFGNLTWLSLKDRFPPDPEKEEKARSNIETLLKKLSLWERGGGFNTWPDIYDWERLSVYLSAYVLDFILTAQEAGFEIPNQNLIVNIKSFLKNSLSADYKNWAGWYSKTDIEDIKSYALAMLSRSGENVAAYIATTYARRDKASLFEIINLLRAIQYSADDLPDKARNEQVNDLLKRLENNINATAGKIQIIDNSPDSSEIWSSSVRNTALVLSYLCDTAPGHDLIAYLARSLVEESKAGHFGTTHVNAQVIASLAKYSRIIEPENPDMNIKAMLGETILAETDFTSFNTPAVRVSAPLSAIPANDPVVNYRLKGQGQVWASLKLKSAPAEPDLSGLTTGGFMLSRSFTVLDSEGKETPGMENFRRGDLVRVTVTMMLPAKRQQVVMEDRVPAGFEPVNFRLKDADMSLMSLARNDDDNEEGYGQQRYWYDHQEVWPDKVAVYADYLDKGVYSFSYLARAITPGVYLTPGPKAEEMYAPEIFGRGSGQSISVR